MAKVLEKQVGSIGNYYGNLSVKVEEGKHYWGIENHDGTYWEPIPEPLYNELIKFERSRRRKEKRQQAY